MKPYTGPIVRGDPPPLEFSEDEKQEAIRQNADPRNKAELAREIAQARTPKIRAELEQEYQRLPVSTGTGAGLRGGLGPLKPYTGKVILSEVEETPPSFGQNIVSGLKVGGNNLLTGAKQRLDEGANYLESKFGGQGINQFLGMENAADILPKTNKQIIANRAIDAPVMATAGGKVGNFLSTAVPAVGAGLIPGGQGLAGSMLAGGLFGLGQPTVPGESVAMNTGVGVLSGGAGYGGGKVLGAAGSKLSSAMANSKAANAVKDALASQSKDLGYTIPPTQTNATGVRGFINKTAEGLAGKLSTAQKASQKNQPVTNALIAKDLGLPVDQPLSIEALKGVRTRAGAAYDEVKKLGTIVTDKKFLDDLDDIVATTRNAEKDFPGLGDTKLEDIVKSLKQPQFKADNALAAIKLIRNKTDAAYAQNDKTLGEAYRKAAGVLEDMIERTASKSNPDLLKNFRKARTDIAKTYTVEKALNDSTGNVNAVKLAAKLTAGKPMTGETRKVAQFAQGHKEAAQTLTSSIPGTSPLDWIPALTAGGAGALMGDMGTTAALATAATLARPAVRTGLLSGPYQKLMTTPSYQSMLAKALENKITQEGIRAGTLAGLPHFMQQ